jgi:hypothetical protein
MAPKAKTKPIPRLTTAGHAEALSTIRDARKAAQGQLQKLRAELRQDTGQGGGCVWGRMFTAVRMPGYP